MTQTVETPSQVARALAERAAQLSAPNPSTGAKQIRELSQVFALVAIAEALEHLVGNGR